jgi:hypothetical protein
LTSPDWFHDVPSLPSIRYREKEGSSWEIKWSELDGGHTQFYLLSGYECVAYVNCSKRPYVYAVKSWAISPVKSTMYVVSGLWDTFSLSSGVDPPLMIRVRIVTETMETSFIVGVEFEFEFEFPVSCKHSLLGT